MKKGKRALTTSNVMSTKTRTFEFDGIFLESLGKSDRDGHWIIGGDSASGKTTYVFQLGKYLLKFGNVLYNSQEIVPTSIVMKRVLERTDMTDVKGFLIDRLDIDEMIIRLKKHKSPNIIIIDSIQHAMIKKKQYLELKKLFPRKLFIWITHFDNRNKPSGSLAQFIWYDANIKMRTEGYRMFADSRYIDGGKGEPYTIWKEGADKYWGDIEY